MLTNNMELLNTMNYVHIVSHVTISRLMIVSQRGQEAAAIIRKTKITRPLSELFTRKSANIRKSPTL